MEWLKKNSLLSTEGEKILVLGIDADFSITSSMLDEKGNDIFNKHYYSWLKTIDYLENIDLKILNDGLHEYKSS